MTDRARCIASRLQRCRISTKIAANMRKEVVVAIILGIGFGLVIGFGVWRANSALSNRGKDGVVDTADSGVGVTPTSTNTQIAIRGLSSGEVIVENPIRLAGNTIPDTRVVVSGEEEDYITISDENGEFAVSVELVGGINQLRIFAFDGSSRLEKDIDIVYSSEFGVTDGDEEEDVDSEG